jgi:hypothetical protein
VRVMSPDSPTEETIGANDAERVFASRPYLTAQQVRNQAEIIYHGLLLRGYDVRAYMFREMGYIISKTRGEE